MRVGGFVVDVARPNLLIEIQTGGFTPLRRKLDALLQEHRVLVVHPVAVKRWIVKPDSPTSRRRSPRQGRVLDVCEGLVAFPTLLSHPRFELEVVLIHEDEHRRKDPRRGRRRKAWVVEERHLVEVVRTVRIASPRDLAAQLPPTLPNPFTTQDLAEALQRPRYHAQKVAYCLRESGAVTPAGRDRRGWSYRR